MARQLQSDDTTDWSSLVRNVLRQVQRLAGQPPFALSEAHMASSHYMYIWGIHNRLSIGIWIKNIVHLIRFIMAVTKGAWKGLEFFVRRGSNFFKLRSSKKLLAGWPFVLQSVFLCALVPQHEVCSCGTVCKLIFLLSPSIFLYRRNHTVTIVEDTSVIF